MSIWVPKIDGPPNIVWADHVNRLQNEKLDKDLVNFIYPRDYGAELNGVHDDTAAVRLAINAALINEADPTPILFSGPCRITDTLYIDRLVDSDPDGHPWLRLIGDGPRAGIYVDSAINLFGVSPAFEAAHPSTTSPTSEHVSFEDMVFESDLPSRMAYVLAPDVFLRLQFINCSFMKIKCAKSSIYTQTHYFHHCQIRFWEDTFLETVSLYDVAFQGCLVEGGNGARGRLISSIGGTGGHASISLRLIGNLIQGLPYGTLKTDGNHGVSVIGNYLENNGTYGVAHDLDFDGGVRESTSISVIGNFVSTPTSCRKASFYADFTDYSGTVPGAIHGHAVGHGITTTQIISIHASVKYNGSFTVTRLDNDNFYFMAPYVDDRTGVVANRSAQQAAIKWPTTGNHVSFGNTAFGTLHDASVRNVESFGDMTADLHNPDEIFKLPGIIGALIPYSVNGDPPTLGLFAGDGTPNNDFGSESDIYFDRYVTDGFPIRQRRAGIWTGIPGGPPLIAETAQATGSVTLNPGIDWPVLRFNDTLTGNVTITLGTTGARNGDYFRIVRYANPPGSFTVDVGGLRTLQADKNAYAEVIFDGSAWRLVSYGFLADYSPFDPIIDARLADVPNSGDATTDGLIDALRDLVITLGLGASA